jgi:RNA polymerase sigma-70 factor (ECF subfamily)
MNTTLNTQAHDSVNSFLLQADRQADFCQMVNAHRSRLYRFILKKVGHPDDAADLAQQAFVEAFRSLQSFRGESELSTWLYGIALNLARGYLMRAPHRTHRFESEEILIDMPGQELDPNAQATLTETVSAVQYHFNALPNDMRTILEMVTVDEMSYEEAAQELNIPVGTVRSRVFRARAQLKIALEASGIEAF